MSAVVGDTFPSVVVDGMLNEWELFTWPQEKLAYYKWMDPAEIHGENDVSVQYNIQCNSDYVFIVLNITDDTRYFAYERFDPPVSNDCIHLYYYSDKEHQRKGQLFVTKNSNNEIIILGSEPQFFVERPYLMTGNDIHAALQENDEGYTAEIAIPARMFGLESLDENTEFGINIEVFDVDKKYDTEFLCEAKMQLHDMEADFWMGNIPRTSVPITQSITYEPPRPFSDATGEHSLLRAQYYMNSELYHLAYADLARIVNDADVANTVKSEALDILNELNRDLPKKCRAASEKYYQYRPFYTSTAIEMLAFSMLMTPDDAYQYDTIDMMNKYQLYSVGIYSTYVELLDSVLPHVTTDVEMITTKLILARNHFFNHEYDTADQRCRALVQEYGDNIPENLNAQIAMLQLSIEWLKTDRQMVAHYWSVERDEEN
jgi:hypothetical protein